MLPSRCWRSRCTWVKHRLPGIIPAQPNTPDRTRRPVIARPSRTSMSFQRAAGSCKTAGSSGEIPSVGPRRPDAFAGSPAGTGRDVRGPGRPGTAWLRLLRTGQAIPDPASAGSKSRWHHERPLVLHSDAGRFLFIRLVGGNAVTGYRKPTSKLYRWRCKHARHQHHPRAA